MARFKIEILPEAKNELREIGLFHMNAVGPNSARKITDKILNRIELLADFPLSGPHVPDDEMRNKGYRMVVCGKYLCFYRVIGQAVFVYHIAHGATDYPRLFR